MARLGLTAAVVAATVCLSACAQTNMPSDAEAAVDAAAATADAARDCSPLRSATLVVVANVDSLNDYAPFREALVVGLIDRLVRGDTDGDGVPDERPLDSVRLAVVANEMFDDRFERLGCGQPSRGELIDSACGGGGNIQTILATDTTWQEETNCRLQDLPGDGATCVGEPLEAALVALAPDPAPVDLSPRTPLGDTTNRAYRDVNDVLVVVVEASDGRDDCSRRIEEVGVESGRCPVEHPYCCAANLPPVSRTSDALRAIVGTRPAVFASFGAHGAFDPRADDRTRLDALERMPECFLSRPHTRMVQLAAGLYPDMHLVPVSCAVSEPDTRGLEGLAAHILGEVCD